MKLTAAALAGAMLVCTPTFAHDWLDGKRGSGGDLCCGQNDCREVHARHVSLPAPGYRVIETGELVPESEALPSPDGKFWRCFWGGSMRCFFSPIPSY